MSRILARAAWAASMALAVLGSPLPAQSDERSRVPYGVGERLEYDVHFGAVRVGSGTMEVEGLEQVRGREAWHTVLSVRGGIKLFYRVNDRYESWIDARTLASLRHVQQISQGGYRRKSTYEIFPERRLYSQGDSLLPSVESPLDEGSFLYFLRTIPLVVGETYSFDRYFRPDRNPVTIRVVRRERIRVPAGEFNAIVVQPVIKARGIFSENGRAEVWLSDDENRIMLQMKSGLSFGSLNLLLKSYRPAKAGATTGAQ